VSRCPRTAAFVWKRHLSRRCCPARPCVSPQRSSRKLSCAPAVDRNKLQSIERILLDTVSDLQQSQLSRQGCNAASASTKETFSYSEVEELEVDASPDHDSRKRSRRQNHKNEQKNVLMSWFIKHECDPYPNNDEKYALAKAAGLQVRQVEHWFTNRRKRYWRGQANQPREGRPLAEQAFVERGLSYPALAQPASRVVHSTHKCAPQNE